MEFIATLNMFVTFAFIGLIVYAMVSDIKYLTIKNWISIALIIAFAIHASLTLSLVDVIWHIIPAACVFVVGFALFCLRWIAGGDVKLMAAISLWAGPDLILHFALLTTWLGLGLASVVLAVQWLNNYGEVIGMPSGARKIIPRWAKHGLVPYGLAIGLAALVIIPERLM